MDVLIKKRVTNNGIFPQYYVENNHEAIIPCDLFMQVQEELVRRANLRANKDGTKRVYSSKYATRVNKGPRGCDADVITEREIHNAELVKLQEQLLQRVNANKDYEDIAIEIDRLRENNALIGA